MMRFIYASIGWIITMQIFGGNIFSPIGIMFLLLVGSLFYFPTILILAVADSIPKLFHTRKKRHFLWFNVYSLIMFTSVGFFLIYQSIEQAKDQQTILGTISALQAVILPTFGAWIGYAIGVHKGKIT